MSTDAAFRGEVRRQAVACGWPADVADVLARRVGRDPKKDMTERPKQYVQAKLPRAQAPASLGITLERAISMFGLPANVTGLFRGAGVTTAEAAAPALRDFVRASARTTPADALGKLKFHLLSRKFWRPQ